MYPIEDIPLPKRKGGRPKNGKSSHFPFASMVPGNSFFVPILDMGVTAVAAAAKEWARSRNIEFSTRFTPNDDIHKQPGTRCWRTR